MGDGHGKGGFLLLVVAVLVSVAGSAAFWVSLQSGRNAARHDEERAILVPLLGAVETEVLRRATAEFGPDVLDWFGHGVSDSGDTRREEWRAGLKRPGARLLEATVWVELKGRFFKRYSGIRVDTSGHPYDAVFLRLLSDALAEKGLRIAAPDP